MSDRRNQREASVGISTADIRYLDAAHPWPGKPGATSVIVPLIAAYAALVWLINTFAPADSKVVELLVDWMALPVQVVAALATAYAARKWRRAALPARACWASLCAASILSIVSLIYWNEWEPYQKIPWLATGDLLYLLDYALIGSALASLFVLFGGRLRSPLIWLDGLSILAAVLATIWAMTFGPLAPVHPAAVLPWGYASGYGLAAALLLTVGSLVWMRTPANVANRWVTALIGAAFVQAAWIIGWIGCWLTKDDFLMYLADYGEVVCYSLISVAALTAPEPSAGVREAPDMRRTAFAFLPTLAILISIALISGLLATRPGAGSWVVTGLILLCLLLLLTRHRIATAEFRRLHDELARRASDERVSELVRQSADAFIVVTPDGLIDFASPAVESVLSVSQVHLVGSPLSAAFGPVNATAIEQFLHVVCTRPSANEPLELRMPSGAGEPRVVRILAANRLDNPRICGVTLVVTDISKERALEREVIDIAGAERLRLAADVHDGIGQELTGIALLLQRLVNRDNDGPHDQRQELTEVIGYLSHTIGDVRELAHGLSPLYVVHGSLTRALRAFTDQAASPRVEVVVDPEFNDRHLDATVGEHLYQIAAEAVRNARRHAACTRISVSLTGEPERVVLSIADDGKGFRTEDAGVARRGAGVRLMEYRARVIGAVLQVRSRPQGGTRLTATLGIRGDGRGHGASGSSLEL